MSRTLLIVLIFTGLIQFVSSQQELASRFEVSTGCYGITSQDFVVPTCAGQTIIAVLGVYLAVKRTDTGCPQIANEDNRDEGNCCRVAGGDCKFPLAVNGAGNPYYSNCTGVFQCTMRVTWDFSTACNDIVYLSRSNYMIMEYFCVKRSEALDGVQPGPISGQAVYLKSNRYPTSIPASTGATCSVSASCITTIVVTAIHIKLEDTPGTCQQSLTLTDGASSHIINCNDNNDYVIRVVYTSQTHFLKVDFVNGKSGDGGLYWFEFKASHGTANLEMRCGASAATTAPTVSQCQDEATTANNQAGSASPVNNQVSNPQSTNNQAQSAADLDQLKSQLTATTVLVSILGIAFIALIVILIGWKCCCKDKEQSADQVPARNQVIPSNPPAATKHQ